MIIFSTFSITVQERLGLAICLACRLVLSRLNVILVEILDFAS